MNFKIGDKAKALEDFKHNGIKKGDVFIVCFIESDNYSDKKYLCFEKDWDGEERYRVGYDSERFKKIKTK